jgi:group I intron endonuclease
MKYWTIYCHTHIDTGRRYIGLTQYTMMHRWNQHCSQSKHVKDSRSHFANAIRLYGKDAFEHQVLAMSWDLEGANATEFAIIEQEGTRDPKIGFNIMKGGGSRINSAIFSSQDFRSKMSLINTGRVLSAEVRSAISCRMLGHKKSSDVRSKLSSALRGHVMSEETCRKISEALKYKTVSLETRKKISQKLTGRRHTEESKIRMSIIQRQKADERMAGIRMRHAMPRPTQTQTHKLCKKHGQVSLEECFSLTRNGIVYYECRRCRRFYTKKFKEKRAKSIAV